jgi:predicted RNA-binding Zn-ribbon protein involved in translation (DUF1610 family)
MKNSKLIAKWMKEGLRPSDFEFLTNRPNLVIGKLPGHQAEVEYRCESCGYYEIKQIEMEKGKKKFKRPKFNCSSCNALIRVPELKKV